MQYLASIPDPKIVVVQDLDSPRVGSFWGEINANMHKGISNNSARMKQREIFSRIEDKSAEILSDFEHFRRR